MPFTPSHAVVALAFARTPLVPAAIAVGAMTPDLPLFVRAVVPPYALTHDARWLAVTTLWALLLLVGWRAVLRPAAGELSPTWLAARLPASWRRGPAAGLREMVGPAGRRVRAASVAILVLSLALGVLTHIGWDLFTHGGRGGVLALPFLAQAWGPWPGYRWLQHGSSLVGLTILAVAAAVWLRSRRPAPIVRTLPDAVRVLWWLSLPATLVIACAVGLALWGPLGEEYTFAHLAYRILPPACAIWGAGTLVLCAAVVLARARTTARDGES